MQTFTPPPGPIRLGLLEMVADRPFTAPERSHADLDTLERMRARLRDTLAETQAAPANPDLEEIHIQYVHERDGRLHRMVIIDRMALLEQAERAVVGFFGQRRGEANPALLQDVDTELIREFLYHRYVLCYSSLELDGGNWANMVILQHIDGIEHWRLSQKHAYAARDLAPLHYSEIRLHNGLLPRGLASPRLLLTATKYYDFGGGEVWRAIREERNTT